ncbi:MAG: hypothetical protein LCH54_13925 [Bacteroidetes bacterium]|nr:hypothetical protein [Bacteroidota bacterium]
MKKFIFSLFSILFFIPLGCQDESSLIESKYFSSLPVVKETKPITSLSQNEATSGGNLVTAKGNNIVAKGVCWSIYENPTYKQSRTIDGKEIGEYTSNLTGLVANTTYHIRAYAQTNDDVAYGPELIFTTLKAVSPVVTTLSVSEITISSVKTGGSISSDGGSEIIEKGVVWGTGSLPDITLNLKTQQGSGTSSFISQIGDLEPNKSYYVRAYATNKDGITGYGATQSFTTEIGTPIVLTGEIASKTDSSAICSGIISFDGGIGISAKGIVWNTTGSPEITLTTKTNEGTGITGFNSVIYKLNPNKTYFARAYATNYAGKTGYGNEVVFTTNFGTPVLTTKAITSMTSTSATSGGTISFDGGAAISIKGVVWSTYPNPEISLLTKTTDGTGTGGYTSSMTGLMPNRTYFVRAYATNTDSKTGYGNEISFTTNVGDPEVQTSEITSITSNSAVGGGSVLFDGGKQITAKGVVWSTTQNPTITLTTKTNDIGTGDPFTSSLSGLEQGKTYFVRAYATNSSGKTGYGDNISFKTLSIPTVSTLPIDAITDSSASSGGVFSSDGGLQVTEKGVVWSTHEDPDISLPTKTLDGTGSGAFTSSITQLSPNTTYYVRAYATNSAGTGYGRQVSFKTSLTQPTVSTSPITFTTYNSSISGGNITSDGGASVTSRGVCWSTNQNPDIFLPTKTINGTGTGAFTSSITGLSPNTTYYVRAYATNSSGTGYGEEIRFATSITSPTVSTSPITSTTYNSSISGGNITSDGGSIVTSRGVCWSTSHNPDISLPTKTSDGTGTGTFNSSITGLNPNTTYYVRAYATNSVGTRYGTQINFTTNVTSPIVTTSTSSATGPNSGKSGGTVSFDGGANVSARGVCWSTSQNPDISLSTTVDGTGTGTFTSTLTGLSPNTTYYVRAYATNKISTGYGSQLSFTTKAVSNPIVSTLTVTSIKISSANSGGTITVEGGASVTSRGVCWSTSQNPDISLATKTIDGIGTGSFISTLTGLNQNTTYYVRAYATNSGGKTGYGENVSFKTLVVPTVNTLPITALKNSSASSGGVFGSDGGLPVTEKGIVWSTNEDPNISLPTKTSDGTGTGAFTSSITGLNPNTTYYVRAYATSNAGTGYGSQLSFTTTGKLIPVVSTTSITSITSNSAICEGIVISDEGEPLTSRGVCWSTSQNPDISLLTKTTDGTVTGTFTSSITGLSPYTTYYVRAYATNNAGTGYGPQLSFETYGFLEYNGFNYRTVKIGSQEWTVENLQTTKYNDGTSITKTNDNTTWSSTTNGAYCAYDTTESNVATYGFLYNWYAVNTGNLAPSGWRVPTDADWTKLIDYAGGELIAGSKLKAKTGWNSNGNGTDEFRFSAIPSGLRINSNGVFAYVGNYGSWWSSTPNDLESAWYRLMYFDNPRVLRNSFYNLGSGYSIRLVRDL